MDSIKGSLLPGGKQIRVEFPGGFEIIYNLYTMDDLDKDLWCVGQPSVRRGSRLQYWIANNLRYSVLWVNEVMTERGLEKLYDVDESGEWIFITKQMGYDTKRIISQWIKENPYFCL